jgi:hypothetical protein
MEMTPLDEVEETLKAWKKKKKKKQKKRERKTKMSTRVKKTPRKPNI